MTTHSVDEFDMPHEFDPDVAIGERIQFAMRRKGITQSQMAGYLNIDPPLLSKKLKGKRRWYFTEIATVAVYLQMHVAELVGGSAPEDWTRPYALEPEARPKGFEPLTFCSDVSAGHKPARHLRIVA